VSAAAAAAIPSDVAARVSALGVQSAAVLESQPSGEGSSMAAAGDDGVNDEQEVGSSDGSSGSSSDSSSGSDASDSDGSEKGDWLGDLPSAPSHTAAQQSGQQGLGRTSKRSK
jgi:hypothetical protein